MHRGVPHDAEVIRELPTGSSTTSSYHSAPEPSYTAPESSHRASEPSCCKSSWAFFRSLISSPFYKTEVSYLSLVHLICTLAIGISLSIAVEIWEVSSVTKSNLFQFLVVYMWISNIWIIGAFCCGNAKFGCCVAQRQLDGQIPGYLIIGVTFLCIGSSFITAVDFLPYAFSTVCKPSNSTNNTGLTEALEKELRSEAIYSATKFVFLILQLYFFCRFSNKTFMNTCSMKIFLMHIIAVNLCTWFYIIVDESVDHAQTNWYPQIQNCLPFEVVNKTKVIDGFLYPFNIEYSVMSSVLLFLMWFGLKKNENQENGEGPEGPQITCCERLKIFFYEKCCNEGMPQGQRKPMSFWRSAICGYVLGVVILVYILLIITVFGLVFQDDQFHSVYFYLGSRITVFFLMSVVCLFGLKYLKQHDPGDQTHHTIVDTALIMIGVGGCYLLTGLKMTAAASDYSTCFNGSTKYPATKLGCMYLRMTLTESVFGLIQFTLQALFIVRALRRCSLVVLPNGKISSAMVVRRCSAFLSIANIGIWAMDTFELKGFKYTEIPATRAYTIHTWRILSHISFPLCIFFRLHSVFCCFELVINRFGIVLQEDAYRRVRTNEDEESYHDALAS